MPADSSSTQRSALDPDVPSNTPRNTRAGAMTRATSVATITLVFSTIYLLAFFQVFSLPLVDSKTAHQLLPVIPWWLLVSSGSYALWCLGWGLFTFRDCPEAYTELLGEITQAKNDLRTRGVTVD